MSATATSMTNPLLPLRVRGVHYQLGDKRLLDDIHITITHPGITAIVGQNGAGKSLLLRLLHGLKKPSSGEILWGDGEKLDHDSGARRHWSAVYRQQAMVFQQPVLLRRSVKANIDFVLPRAERQRSAEILSAAGLSALAAMPARQLSGGEQQRLAMARAIATQPKVLFLDEATANLDPRSVLELEQQILSISQQGCKIFLVTHDQGQLRRLADEVVFLHAGRLMEHTPKDVFLVSPQSPAARAYLAGELLI